MIIDMHTHILPPEIPKFKDKFGYGGFIELQNEQDHALMFNDDGVFFRKIQANCYDAKARLEELDLSLVDRQVLCTIPVMFSYFAKPKDGAYVSRFLNDDLSKVLQKYPNSFIGLGTLPMQDPALAITELEYCKKLGLPGVQIGSHINDWNLDHPKVFEVFEACQDLDMAVFVHPWDMMGKSKMPKYWLPWLVGMPAETCLAICSMIFGGVLERLPKLRVCFAHGGGSFAFTLGRIEHGFKVRPDLCAADNDVNPKNYLGKMWFDSITHDHKALEFLIDTVGEDKVCLGSDYPFPLGELEPGKLIDESNFSCEVKEKLFSTNACDWLGVDKNEFKS